MVRRNILKTTLVIAMALVVLLLILNGWIVSPGHNLTSQAAALELARPNTAPNISLAAIPAAQGPSIILEPFAGPAASAVTVKGNGWQAGNEVLISVQDDQGQLYKVANTVVGGEGDFSVSFFVPDFWKSHTTVTVVAQAVGGPQASAFYTVTDVPTPAATAQLQEPQGVVNINALNVRSGPGDFYPIVGRLLMDQPVRITGQNNDWWQIEFPNATGDFGWVAGQFINATNVENIPVQNAPPTPLPPTPTPIPTPNFQCNPGQWSGCGGASCSAEYVSQCGNDGQWMQCVWDPGHCIPPTAVHHEEERHTRHFPRDHHNRQNYNPVQVVPSFGGYPVPYKK